MYKRLDSYEEVEKFWNSCRFKDKGKPIGSWGRLFKRGDRFDFHVNPNSRDGDYNFRNCFASLHPHDTIEFNLTVEQVRNHAQTLGTSMDNIIPFGIHRISMLRYRIWDADGLIPNPQKDTNVWRRKWEFRKQAPEYFQGIKFNMLTREGLNRQPDKLPPVEIPEKRLEWRRKLATYKKGLKARAKLGAFDSHIQTLSTNPNHRQHLNAWARDWVDSDRLNLLHESMENVDYPQELLSEIAKSCLSNYFYGYESINRDHIQWEIDRIFKQASIPLRKKFGVFEQEDK